MCKCKTLSVTGAVLLRTVYICIINRFHVSLAMSQSTLSYVIFCYAVNKFFQTTKQHSAILQWTTLVA